MRVLSGIQPSGDYLHIGNYFGALRQFVALQEEHEMLLFIADYHSMNSVRDGAQRRAFTRSVALDYLACGLDPTRAMLFRQSDMPEVTELSWMLSTVTPMGLLERAVSYKDKVAQGQPTDHGLFAYPVLQAADILIYRSELVPVGQDQKQHIEMARDIAQRFNNTYGEDLLVLPEPYIPEEVAVVPGTDGRKMSKSYGNAIAMFAAPAEVKKAVMGIVTDSTPVEASKDPTTHLFQLWALFASEEERAEMKARAAAGGLGYGEVKKDLLARLTARFAPMRERREALAARPSEVEDVLADGARRARDRAARARRVPRSRGPGRKAMTINELGSIGEVISALAVVVTLWYLAVQIRQNTHAMEEGRRLALAQTYQVRADALQNMLVQAADSQYIGPLITKLTQQGYPEDVSALDRLSPDERGRFRQWQIAQQTHWDNMFFQYQQGYLDEEYYQDSFRERVARLAPTWKALGITGGRRSFTDEIERLLAERTRAVDEAPPQA